MNGWDRGREQSRMLERVAATCLGLAVAFAAWSLSSALAEAPRAGLASIAAIAAFVLASAFLDRFGSPSARDAVMPSIDGRTPSALLLRLQDVLAEASAADIAHEELLLDDPLPQAPPGSRVVQLFQPSTMPTAGELQARIVQHLGSKEPLAALPADDSDELFEALASLRRSLG
jgi:hypothetical protein